MTFKEIEEQLKQQIKIFKYEDFVNMYVKDRKRFSEMMKDIPLPEGEIFESFRQKMIELVNNSENRDE